MAQRQMAQRQVASKELRGIHVFFWIVAFFAVTIAVDVFFVVRAVNTFPGEQVKNSYVLGLDYNRQLERRAEQEKLGWVAEAGMINESLVVRVRAGSGPVTGLKVDVGVILPGRGADMLKLKERAPGEYAAAIDLQGARRVELEIKATRADAIAPVFEATKVLEIGT